MRLHKELFREMTNQRLSALCFWALVIPWTATLCAEDSKRDNSLGSFHVIIAYTWVAESMDGAVIDIKQKKEGEVVISESSFEKIVEGRQEAENRKKGVGVGNFSPLPKNVGKIRLQMTITRCQLGTNELEKKVNQLNGTFNWLGIYQVSSKESVALYLSEDPNDGALLSAYTASGDNSLQAPNIGQYVRDRIVTYIAGLK